MDEKEVDQLYQEVLLDHYRHPRGEGELEGYQQVFEADNPLCGDHLKLFLKWQDGLVAITFTGRGCAISQASASIMIAALGGMDKQGCKAMLRRFRQIVTPDEPLPTPSEMDDVDALVGIRRFPVRIKCAALAWETFEKAIGELH